MTKFWRYAVSVKALCVTSLGVLSLLTAALSPANTGYQSTTSIEKAVREATRDRAVAHGYDNVTVDVRRLDPRLRLSQCTEALETNISAVGAVLGAVSTAVSCHDKTPWTIYVRSQVSALQAIPVLNKPLARNSIITAEDIKQISQPVAQSTGGIVLEMDQLIGMELTRALDAGSTLRLNNLRKPNVIKRGQQVTLVSGTQGLEVRISGKALANAAAGERVAVSNLSSGKRVEGIAHSDGTVSVE